MQIRQGCAVWVIGALGAVGAVSGYGQSSVHTASIHLDPSQTQIRFTAGSIRHVHGSLQMKEGLFAVDTATGVAQGEVLVDATSEKSNSAGTDKKVQTGTLDAKTYPGIVFHPESVHGALPPAHGSSHLQLTGTLTVHGKDHPLTVDLEVKRNGPELLFTSAFTVPYVQWGLKNASSFLMHARDVRITMVSHGTLQAPKS